MRGNTRRATDYLSDDAARSFAIGFYGGLGERESIATAYAQGCAAIRLRGLADRDRPRLAARTGVDASKLVLAADPVERSKTDALDRAVPQVVTGGGDGTEPR